MPPRQTPPPSGKPRRRPSPGMTGSWIWLVILGAVLLMLLVNVAGDRKKLDYSDFLRIVLDDEYAKNLNKIVMVGTDKIEVEVKSADDLPEEIRDKLHGSKAFWVARQQGDETSKSLDARLTE